MANELDIVSYDMIRAVAGLSKADASDEVLSNLPIELELSLDLEEWLPEYSAILSDTWVETEVGLRDTLVRRIIVYTTYMGAAILCQAAPGLMLKKLSDGVNIGERFSSVDPSKMSDRMLAKATVQKLAIQTAMSTTAEESQPSLFSVVSPSYDPVVGE